MASGMIIASLCRMNWGVQGRNGATLRDHGRSIF